MCWSKPRKPLPPPTKPIARSTKPIPKIGKKTLKWISERKYWIAKNPPDEHGLWYCHYCGVPLVIDKEDIRFQSGAAQWLTIDHIVPRSNRGKIYDHNNLVPCCRTDNVLKGSQEYGRFVERNYPHLFNKSPDIPPDTV